MAPFIIVEDERPVSVSGIRLCSEKGAVHSFEEKYPSIWVRRRRTRTVHSTLVPIKSMHTDSLGSCSPHSSSPTSEVAAHSYSFSSLCSWPCTPPRSPHSSSSSHPVPSSPEATTTSSNLRSAEPVPFDPFGARQGTSQPLPRPLAPGFIGSSRAITRPAPAAPAVRNMCNQRTRCSTLARVPAMVGILRGKETPQSHKKAGLQADALSAAVTQPCVPPGADLTLVEAQSAVLGMLQMWRYKCQLCRNWTQKGHCHYGEHCSFAHGEADLKTEEDKRAMLDLAAYLVAFGAQLTQLDAQLNAA